MRTDMQQLHVLTGILRQEGLEHFAVGLYVVIVYVSYTE